MSMGSPAVGARDGFITTTVFETWDQCGDVRGLPPIVMKFYVIRRQGVFCCLLFSAHFDMDIIVIRRLRERTVRSLSMLTKIDLLKPCKIRHSIVLKIIAIQARI